MISPPNSLLCRYVTQALEGLSLTFFYTLSTTLINSCIIAVRRQAISMPFLPFRRGGGSRTRNIMIKSRTKVLLEIKITRYSTPVDLQVSRAFTTKGHQGGLLLARRKCTHLSANFCQTSVCGVALIPASNDTRKLVNANVVLILQRIHSTGINGYCKTSPELCLVQCPACPTCYLAKMLEWEEKRNREAAERADKREQVGWMRTRAKRSPSRKSLFPEDSHTSSNIQQT